VFPRAESILLDGITSRPVRESLSDSAKREDALAVFFVDKNSESFRGSLNEVFRRALWPTPVVDAVNSVDGKGITVRSRPNEGPAFALASLLRGMGYQVSHIADAENTAGGFQIYILNKPQ
jgi:hypothetical protein